MDKEELVHLTVVSSGFRLEKPRGFRLVSLLFSVVLRTCLERVCTCLC